MQKLYFILYSICLMMCLSAQSQIVSTTPSPLQENSENVVITYYSDQGNKGLINQPASDPIYAHVGVITNKSNGSWAYAPAWKDNSAKYKLEYVKENVWNLNIGDIRTYFGITDPEEIVQQIALVFRNASASKEGKTAMGGDIFVDVLPAGFQLEFTSNAPFTLSSETSTVTFTARTTANAKIELFLDKTSSEPLASKDNTSELVYEYTFALGAENQIIAVATAGDNTATQSIDICYPGESKEQAWPGSESTPVMGATANADGTVTFCLAAPNKTNAMIIGSWCDYAPKSHNVMNYTDIDGIRYFWITVDGLDKNTEYPYYYLVDNTRKVGDPYARLVLDPYNDKWLSDGQYPGLIPYPADKVSGNVMLAVYNGSCDEYQWKNTDFKAPAKENLIIYELLVRDFTGTEGKADGNGTIVTALDKLPYLKELGINAIELMPIQEFNGNNSWGYNTNFYFAPDKAYGSPSDYRAFIDACHGEGIAVILDVVFNQSDGLHPWYQLYDAGSNPFYNERAPHAYSVLNDWNQDNLLVQQQWTDMIQYWLTAYKVDGFRFDLVKGLGDNESYGGNASETNTNQYNSSRVARMKRLTEVMHAVNPDAYSINENLAGSKEENEMAKNGQLNWANINNAACQFAMGYSSDSDCNRFYAPKDSRDWGSTVSYAESHDEQRVAYKQDQWGVSGVKGNLDASMVRLGSVAAQMLLSPGAHMIWQFGELGNATNTKNSDGSNNTDPKPVLWDYLDVPARKALHNNYQELIAIRNNSPELFAEGANFQISCAASNWSNGRYIYASTDSKELICVINPNTEQKTFTNVKFGVTDNSLYKITSQSDVEGIAFDAAGAQVTLPAGAYVVITRGNVLSVDDAWDDANTLTVSGGKGEIIINGNYNCANAYDLQGRACQLQHLAPGFYIVVIDGKSHKVAVR